jgi:hypothetical protein
MRRPGEGISKEHVASTQPPGIAIDNAPPMTDINEEDQAPRPPPPDTLRALEEQSTPKLTGKARRYAEGRVQLVRDAGYAVPENYDHELVHDAYTDTWSGAAEWDPSRCSLLVHLRGVIKLRTWAAVRHERRFQRVSLDADADPDADVGPEDDADALEQLLVASSGDLGPIRFVSLLRRVCAAMREHARLDGDDPAVLACWELGFVDSDEIMRITGLDAIAYKRARRRLLYQCRDLPSDLREEVKDALRRMS